jgi:hypothetical protein
LKYYKMLVKFIMHRNICIPYKNTLKGVVKVLVIIFITLIPFTVLGQKEIDLSRITQITFSPQVYVNNSRQDVEISLNELHKYGLQVVLDDKTFKVIQFEISYDCHSRAYFDFSEKKYKGDRVPPTDDYLRKRIWVGDVIVVYNVLIERGKERYIMKDKGYIIKM